jgi:hypothetical protein
VANDPDGELSCTLERSGGDRKPGEDGAEGGSETWWLDVGKTCPDDFVAAAAWRAASTCTEPCVRCDEFKIGMGEVEGPGTATPTGFFWRFIPVQPADTYRYIDI